jgi:peptide/nickel transport system ATP-binding protein
VQDEHRRVDPVLTRVPGDADHAVACLLPAQTRNAVWQALSRGESVQQAQRLARVESRVASAAADPPAAAGSGEHREVQP